MRFKKILSGIFILMLCLSYIIIETPLKANAEIGGYDILVDDSYTGSETGFGTTKFKKIQDAIDVATSGESIFVFVGTYQEHIVISKSNIELFGEIKEDSNEYALINPSGGTGIKIINGHYNKIYGFHIDAGSLSDDAGIHIVSDQYNFEAGHYWGCQNNIIENNEIFNTESGIRLQYVVNTEISWNTIHDNDAHGIHIIDQCSSDMIKNNIIYSNGEDGILVEKNSDGTYFRFNDIYDNGGFGINANGGHWVEIFENKIYQNNKGVFYEGPGWIKHNLIENNDDYGIYIKDGDLSPIETNYVSDNGGHGLILYSTDWANVNGNYIDDNYKTNLYLLESDFNSISGNPIKNFFSYSKNGIHLKSSCNNIITDHIIWDNEMNQIKLTDNSNYNIFDNNDIAYEGSVGPNTRSGIRILNSYNNEFINNKIYTKYNLKTLQYGIYLGGSDNLIKSNNIHYIDTGIYLSGSSNNIIDNNIHENKYGIDISTGTLNNIKGNEIKYNDYGIQTTSHSNTIYYNNFNNDNDAIKWAKSGTDNWYSDYYDVGNYWNGYIDNDYNFNGKYDTAYDVFGDGSEKDDFPAVYKFTTPPKCIWMTKLDEDTYHYEGRIQDAINSLAENGLIYLHQQTYSPDSTIYINKPLTLQGEDKDLTIIEGGEISSGPIITITSENAPSEEVRISGFTFKDADHGIKISSSDNNEIKNNIIKKINDKGIYIYSSNSNSIIDNSIYGDDTNYLQYGIYLTSGSSYNNIQNNEIYKTKDSFSYHSGILIDDSSSTNTLDYNKIWNCKNGIYIKGQSEENIVTDNEIYSNNKGIFIKDSDENEIKYRNNIHDNIEYGIFIENCDDSILNLNTIEDNDNGIYLTNSDRNLVYQNNFLTSDGYHGFDNNGNNDWDYNYNTGGEITGGNYWDDYNGQDNGEGDPPYHSGIDYEDDGIGDTMIPFPGSGYDNFPWMDEDGWDSVGGSSGGSRGSTTPKAGFDYDIKLIKPQMPKYQIYLRGGGGLSFDPNGYISNYSWIFGDGSNGTGENITHNYTEAGEYLVKLMVTDNETKTDWIELVINITNESEVKLLIANFTYSSAGNKRYIFNASDSSDALDNITSYFWDFGDGKNITGKIVNHTFFDNGRYNVTLNIVNNQSATSNVTYSILVYNQIFNIPFKAHFNYNFINNFKVIFNGSGSLDLNGSIINYSWTFGDSTNGTGEVIEHTYLESGIYIVNLTITNNTGSKRNCTQILNVTNDTMNFEFFPYCDFSYNFINDTYVQFKCTESYFTDGLIDNFSWAFGDTTNGTGKTIEHNYNSVKEYVVRLKITDKYNNSFDTKKLIKLNELANLTPYPKISYKYKSNLNIIFNSSKSFDPNGNITNFSWVFGDDTNGTGEIIEHNYSKMGDYKVILSIKNDRNYTNSIILNLRIHNNSNYLPIATFSYTPNVPLINQTIYFNGSNCYDFDGSILYYIWNFGDSNVSIGKNVTHIYSQSGKYNITLLIIDNDNNNFTIKRLLEIFEKNIQIPTAIINYSPESPINIGQTIEFNASNSNDNGSIINYTWLFGDGVVIYGEVVEYQFQEVGEYIILLAVRDNEYFFNTSSKKIRIIIFPL